MKTLLGVAAALALAAPAAAGVEVKRVDTSAYPSVAVTVTGSPRRAPDLRENGRPVVGLRAVNLGRAKSVVLAVDRSRSLRGEPLEQALAAARGFVVAKPARDRIAVVAFASRAVRLTRFSSAIIDADLALRAVAVDRRQGTALNDAVVLAAQALAAETSPARVLVLVTDGRDVSSDAGATEAIAAARRAGLVVYAIGIEGPQFSPAPLEALARATGGSYRGAAAASGLAAAYAAVTADLRRTWQLEYVTSARPGEQVTLAAGAARRAVTLPGDSAPAPARAPAAYRSGWAAVLVALLVGLLVLGAVAVAAGGRSRLRARLAPHVERAARARRGRRDRLAAGVALMLATERTLGHFRVWRRVHRLLERADVPLRTVEFLYAALGSAVLFGLVAALAGRSSLVILGALALGGAVPFGVLAAKARRRLNAFENQLPDLLLTIAASLRAGHSFKQGLQTVADEGEPPASKEFQRALAEIRLGRPLEHALTELAERVGSKNLEFVVTAITIQSQVGGSLAGLFDMVADAVRQRQQFARKIRGLTAMGRASAYVLVGLPFFMAGVIALMNPGYMEPLYGTGPGHMLVGVSLVMMAFGSIVLRKIVSFRG